MDPGEGEREMVQDLFGGEGDNEVPVEGIWLTDRTEGVYCDDVVVVRDEQISRLCVMVRVLTSLLTMELVVLGYICAMNDVLRVLMIMGIEQETTSRARVVCRAATDGGVLAAETTIGYDYDQHISFEELDEEISGMDEGSLESSDGEQEIQNDGDSRQFGSEQDDGRSQ